MWTKSHFLCVKVTSEEQRNIMVNHLTNISLEEFAIRQGVPQLTDDNVLLYIEVVSEEQRSIMVNYSMSIASPNEKNLYLSFTAVVYASIILSLPAKADTSISNVLSGRWKFVIKESTALNL